MHSSLPDIVQRLSELSGSDLNSLLLEVYDKKLKDIPPAHLLKLYRANHFAHPAGTDMIGLLTLECKTLEFLRDQHGFQPIECSPAAQLGSCSIVATVSQNKIISATRNTEIVADVTNALALHIANLKSPGSDSSCGKFPLQQSTAQPRSGQSPSPSTEATLRFCTVHRHIRTQEMTGPGFTPHFKVGCLVSSGRDTGSYGFETQHLLEHLQTLDQLFRDLYGIKKIRFKLQRREGYDNRNPLLERVLDHLNNQAPELAITTEDPPVTNNYYKGIQFKMIIGTPDQEIEIADGGFVDWTQQLLGNKKERLLISGFGLERLYKLAPPSPGLV